MTRGCHEAHRWPLLLRLDAADPQHKQTVLYQSWPLLCSPVGKERKKGHKRVQPIEMY